MPTSPVTPPQIPASQTSPAGAAPDGGFVGVPNLGVTPDAAVTMRGEWRRLAAFLRRPSLGVGEQSGAPFTVLARIYALDMAAMFALIVLASAAIAMGVELPETALAGAEFTPIIIFAVIIGAPVLEEVAFRGWLSGKPGHVFALLIIGAGAAVFTFIPLSAPIVRGAVPIAALVGALGVFIAFRKRPAMRWFAALFPGFFWLSTFAFALVHLLNFDEGSLGILLPLVLPQLILGALLGYIRVRIGLWAAILLHAAHNTAAISIAALAIGFAD